MTSDARRSTQRLWAVALLAVLFCYFGIGAFVTLTMTHPQRHLNPAITPASQGLFFSDVSFAARGGDAQLAGWFIPERRGAPASHRAVVLVHGKDSSRSDAFGGHLPELAAALAQRDLAVLAFDLRGHGASSDGRFTLGINESRDVLGSIDFLRQHGYPVGAIGVLGQSMGAAAAIYATAAEPAIGALITDCGFADIAPVLQREWYRRTGLPNLFVPATRITSQALLGLDLSSSRPLSVIGKIAPRPMLIIHGDSDRLIPVSQAMELKQALPSAELWIIAGAGHVGGYNKDPAEFTRRVADFFDHNLPR